MADIRDVFQKNLKRLMEENNTKASTLANITGKSKQSVSNWLNGKLFPRAGVLEVIANHFGVQKSDLLEEKVTLKQKNHLSVLDDIQDLTDDEIKELSIFINFIKSKRNK